MLTSGDKKEERKSQGFPLLLCSQVGCPSSAELFTGKESGF